MPDAVAEQVVIETLYDHYIATQQAHVQKLATMEARGIPREFDYRTMPNLRAEAREKLQKVQPATLGQAGRIAGVTPTDLAALLIALERRRSTKYEVGSTKYEEIIPRALP
jgi:tRNA uridine 5-carboxymethylaminomethyl modification enzyme